MIIKWYTFHKNVKTCTTQQIQNRWCLCRLRKVLRHQKGVIRSPKSTDWQYNDKTRTKRLLMIYKNTLQKTNDWATRTPQKSRDQFMCCYCTMNYITRSTGTLHYSGKSEIITGFNGTICCPIFRFLVSVLVTIVYLFVVFLLTIVSVVLLRLTTSE